MATPQAPPYTPQGVRRREVLNEVGFQGTATAFQASLMNQSLLMLAALVTVYLIVGVLYASDMHPVTILSTLPSAGVGALLALLLCRTDLRVIVRIGIVKKNAIMMIDFALEAERSERKSPAEAIFQACLLRFRPIIMTTMAALLGGLPLALGMGTGAEPVVYLYLDRVQIWCTQLCRRRIRGIPEEFYQGHRGSGVGVGDRCDAEGPSASGLPNPCSHYPSCSIERALHGHHYQMRRPHDDI